MTNEADEKVRVHAVIPRGTYNVIKESGYTIADLIEYASKELLLPELREREQVLKTQKTQLEKELEDLERERKICDKQIEVYESIVALNKLLEDEVANIDI